jgi:hypothetical protein
MTEKTIKTNLPIPNVSDSAEATKLFFDTYGQQPLQFLAAEVDAAIGFFESRGFDKDASNVSAAVLLKQAKLDGIPIFKILDQMKTLNGTQINILVGEILNNNRTVTSTLGFKTTDIVKESQVRNISA